MQTKTETQRMFQATWVSTVRPQGSVAVVTKSTAVPFLRGAPPHTPARSLAGAPPPRAASSRARMCAPGPTHVGLRPTPRLGRLRGAPPPRAASSRARMCAPGLLTWGSAPHPGSVACGGPSAPRRFLAGAHVRAGPTHVGLRPTPRLGRLRGPLRPAPLPRGRACARRAYSRGALPHTPARALAGTLRPGPRPRGRARARRGRHRPAPNEYTIS